MPEYASIARVLPGPAIVITLAIFICNLACGDAEKKKTGAQPQTPVKGLHPFIPALQSRLRQRREEEDWGTAPDPGQGVAPLASPLCNLACGNAEKKKTGAQPQTPVKGLHPL